MGVAEVTWVLSYVYFGVGSSIAVVLGLAGDEEVYLFAFGGGGFGVLDGGLATFFVAWGLGWRFGFGFGFLFCCWRFRLGFLWGGEP